MDQKKERKSFGPLKTHFQDFMTYKINKLRHKNTKK